MKIINEIKYLLSKKLFFYILFFIISLQVIFWFHGNNLISNADFGFMNSPDSDNLKIFYRWDHSRGLGLSQDRNAATLVYTSLLTIIQWITNNISSTEKILFFLWFFISGVSMFILIKFLIRKESTNEIIINIISFICALFYIMNAFLYNYRWGNGFLMSMFIYSIGPLLIYFAIRIFDVKNKTDKIKYFIYFLLANIWAIPSYENPANFLSFYIILIPFLIIYFKDITQNKKLYTLFLIIFCLFNLWWVIRPLSFFESSAYISANSPANNDILKIIEYKDMSFLNIFRLQGFWATNYPEYFPYGSYYFTNPLIIISSIAIFGLPLFLLLFKKERKNQMALVLILFLCIFIFVTKGVHFPFNQIYQWLIDNSVFRMFRSPEKFYFLVVLSLTIILGIFQIKCYKYKKLLGSILSIILLASILINAYPFLFNKIIPNNNVFNSMTIITSDINASFFKKYYSIPETYLKGSNKINSYRLDGKNLIFPDNPNNVFSSWTVYNWSAIGLDPLWNLLGSSPYLILNNNGNSMGINPISSEFLISYYDEYESNFYAYFLKIGNYLSIVNSKYIIFRLDNNHEDVYKNKISKKQIFDELNTNKNIELITSFGSFYIYELNSSFFLPHFYTPQNIILSNQSTEALPEIVSQDNYQIRSAIYFTNQTSNINKSILTNLSSKIDNTPILEFKKINPTKYRVFVHNATQEFPLVFSESFHNGWKAYQVDYTKDNLNTNLLNNYKILDGNEGDQATKEEINQFIEQDLITSLGYGEERIIKHMKWEDNKEKLDYEENYTIDFISKNFQGTIQNDNLPKGHFYETWLQKPIVNESNHLIANGYANSWIINITEICETTPNKCIKNSDGSYDLELIIEFWPQRLFYLGLFISGTTFLCCIGYLIYDWRKKRKLNRYSTRIKFKNFFLRLKI